MMENRVFISYSHEDIDWANQIAERLISYDFSIWKDNEGAYKSKLEGDRQGIPPGVDWMDAIGKAIKECLGFVALITDAYLNSENCIKELKLAFTQNDVQKILIKNTDRTMPDGIDYVASSNNWVMWDEGNEDEIWRKIFGNIDFVNLRNSSEELIIRPCQTRIIGLINNKLENIRKNHHSFQLLNEQEGVSPLLYPKGTNSVQIENKRRMVSTAGSEEKISFQEFFKKSWEKQTHLYIYGPGGIGKTVALLSFVTEKDFLPENVASVYIPLYELSRFIDDQSDCIDKYIKENYSSDEYKEIRKFADMTWKTHPNVILLLDGYNEIDNIATNRWKINESISNWAKRSGTQIVTTSRVEEIILNTKFEKLRLLELSREDIEQYFEERGKDVPNDQKLMKAIHTPLMLRIYCEVEEFNAILNNGILPFKESNCAINIIWNYLMVELCKKERKIDYVVAMLLIAPYIAYQMSKNNHYSFTEDQFKKCIESGCSYWKQRNRPAFFSKIEENYGERSFSELKDPDMVPKQRRILENEVCLFWKKNSAIKSMEYEYCLMHQNLRDSLAALHLLNISEKNQKIPEEFNENISNDVLMYYQDLLTDDKCKKLWNQNKKVNNFTFIINMLRIYGLKKSNDFSDVDFSGVDLSRLNLYQLSVQGREIVRFPKEEKYFEGTKISISSFQSQGHEKKVNNVVITGAGREAVSCGDDGNVFVWDWRAGAKNSFYNGIDPVYLLAIDNEADTIAYSQEGKIHYQTKTNRITLDFSENEEISVEKARVLSLNKEKSIIAAGFSEGFLIWNFEEEDEAKNIHFVPIEDDEFNGNNAVSLLSFDTDGERLIVGTETGELLLYNIADDEFECRQSMEKTSIVAIAINKRLTCMAIATVGGNVDLYDITLPSSQQSSRSNIILKNKRNIATENRIMSITIDAFGNYVSAGFSDGSICIWDIVSGDKVTLVGSGNAVNSIAFDDNGHYLVVGEDDGTVRVWDVENIECKETFAGNNGFIKTVASSANWHHAIIGLSDGTVRIWDIIENKCVAILSGNDGQATLVSANNDLSCIASYYTNDTVVIWKKTRSGTYKRCPQIPYSEVTVLTIDGKNIAWGTKTGRVCCLFDGKKEPKELYNHNEILGDKTAGLPVRKLVFEDDNSILSRSAKGDVQWNYKEGITVYTEVFSVDNRSSWNTEDNIGIAAEARSEKMIENDHEKKEVEEPVKHILEILHEDIKSFCENYSYDLIHQKDGIVELHCVYKKPGNERGSRTIRTSSINLVIMNDERTRLAVHKNNVGVYFWDETDGKLQEMKNGNIAVGYEKLKFNPDGDILVGVGKDGYIRIWKTCDKELVRTIRISNNEKRRFLEAGLFGDPFGQFIVENAFIKDIDEDLFEDGNMDKLLTIDPIYGFNLLGMNLSKAKIMDDVTNPDRAKDILIQNGVKFG